MELKHSIAITLDCQQKQTIDIAMLYLFFFLNYLQKCCEHKNCLFNWPYLSSQNKRITEWLRQEGMSGDHLVKPRCSSKILFSTLSGHSPRQVLNISRRGDSSLSGQLIPVSLTEKKFFLLFNQSCLCFSFVLIAFPNVMIDISRLLYV